MSLQPIAAIASLLRYRGGSVLGGSPASQANYFSAAGTAAALDSGTDPLTFTADGLTFTNLPSTTDAHLWRRYGAALADQAWSSSLTTAGDWTFQWNDGGAITTVTVPASLHGIRAGVPVDLRIEFEPVSPQGNRRLRFYVNNILIHEDVGTSSSVVSTDQELQFLGGANATVDTMFVYNGLPDATRDNYAWNITQQAGGSTIYVATTGNDTTGDGTSGAPYRTVERAWTDASPGDTIEMAAGTYVNAARENLVSKTTPDAQNWIRVKAADGATVVVQATTSDFQGAFDIGNTRFISFEGIEVDTPSYHGFHAKADARNIAFIDCDVHDGGYTGFEIGGTSVTDAARYCYAQDCDSYNNIDSSQANADGFGCKAYGGDSNTFIGCLAHHNSDDGFDFYRGNYTLLIECDAYRNGYNASEVATSGDGNGIKLSGGADSWSGTTRTAAEQGGTRAFRCRSWRNRWDGFTTNSAEMTIELEANTAWDNDRRGVTMYDAAAGSTMVVYNLISYLNGTNDLFDIGTMVTGGNMIQDGTETDPVFASTTYPNASFLHPTAAAQIDAGAARRLGYGGSAPDRGFVETTTVTTVPWTELVELSYDARALWTLTGDVSFGAAPTAAYDAHDDFEANTAGTHPAGWTDRWMPGADFVEVLATDGQDDASKVLSLDASTAEYHLISMDAADALTNVADVDILALVGIPDSGGSLSAQLIARGSGDIGGGTESMYAVDLEGFDSIRLIRLVNGTWTNSTAAYATTAGTWHWLRLRVEGNTQKAKAWPFGQAEPGTWHHENTWTDLTGGWVGVGSWSATPPFKVDEIHVASDGNVAAAP